MSEDEITQIPALYEQKLEDVEQARQEVLEWRDGQIRQAVAEGWLQVDIVNLTGYSRETVRQALDPEAREAARKALADRRAAAKKPARARKTQSPRKGASS